MSRLKLKEYIIEVPVVGTYKYRAMFDDKLTEQEIIERTIKVFNGTSTSTRAYKCLIDGEGVKFPLIHAKVTSV